MIRDTFGAMFQYDTRRAIGNIGCAYHYQAVTLVSFCRSYLDSQMGNFENLQNIMDDVATALELGISMSEESRKITKAFKKAIKTLSCCLGQDDQNNLEERMKLADVKDKEASKMKKNLRERLQTILKDQNEQLVTVKKWGKISHCGYTNRVDLHLKLNPSQPLFIALALLIQSSKVDIRENPHLYQSLDQLDNSQVKNWMWPPLAYGECLKDILNGTDTLFLVVDRNDVDIVQKSDPARIFGNVWKTKRGAIILKDVMGLLESVDRVQPISACSKNGWVPECTESWENMPSRTHVQRFKTAWVVAPESYFAPVPSPAPSTLPAPSTAPSTLPTPSTASAPLNSPAPLTAPSTSTTSSASAPLNSPAPSPTTSTPPARWLDRYVFKPAKHYFGL